MSHNSVTKNINRINNKLKKDRYLLKLDNKNSFYLFPFKPVLGIVNQSNLGINDDINIYEQSSFERVFTGLANLTARWRDSWEVVKANDDDLFLTKSYKVGISYRAFITQVIKGVTFEPSPIDGNFISQVTDETIICYTYDEIPEENIQDFYIVPQLKNNKWFFISSIEEHPQGGTPFYKLTLESVNNRLATTGRAIEEFIQYGAAGEGYPFPLIDEEGNITVDPSKAKDLYIQAMQIEVSGACALSTLHAWGRPTEADIEGGSIKPKFNPKIEAPRLLLPYAIETPIPSPINTKPNSETNYYYGVWQPKFFDQYKSWKEQWTNNFSPVDRTQYEGVLTNDNREKIEASNPINISDNAHQYTIWDRTWKIKLENETFNTSADNMSPNSITLNGDYTLPELLTFNVFITSPIETLPLSVEQLVSWNLRDLPIVGGFLNKLTFGIPLGWRELNVRIPAQKIPLLIPTQIVKYGNAMREQTMPTKDLFLPLEIFAGTLQSDATTFSGINTLSTIFKVQLTDRFSKVINNKTYNFNTKDLGQNMPDKDDDGNIIDFGGTKPTQLLIDNTIKPIARKVVGYVIDFSNWKGITKMPYRLTFFTAGALQTWHGTYKSNAQLTDALRDWTNFMKQSDWSTNDGKYIEYPQDITEPKPPGSNIQNINLTPYLKQSVAYNSMFENETESQRLTSFYSWLRTIYYQNPPGSSASYSNLKGRWNKLRENLGEYDLTNIGGVIGLQRYYETIEVTFSSSTVPTTLYPNPNVYNFTIQLKITDLITSGKVEYDLKKDLWWSNVNPATFDNFGFYNFQTQDLLDISMCNLNTDPPYFCTNNPPQVKNSDRKPFKLYYSEFRNTIFVARISNNKLTFGWSENISGFIPYWVNNDIGDLTKVQPASDLGYGVIWGSVRVEATYYTAKALNTFGIYNDVAKRQIVSFADIKTIGLKRKEVYE